MFDICLMNPPYLGENRNDIGTPYKFLSKVIEISNKVISIQPATIIFKEFLTKHPDKNEQPILDKINKYYSEIEILDHTKFDAKLLSNTAIYYINSQLLNEKIIIKTDNSTKEYSNVKEITKYSNDNLLCEFKNKIKYLYEQDCLAKNHVKWVDKRNKQSVINKEKENKSEQYYLSISAVRGNIGTDDFYTFIPKDRIPEKYNRKTCYINFNSKEECQNCINYLKTDFSRCALYLMKTDMNLLMFCKYVPWFDFSDSHFSKTPREIDDWLFEKYDISDEIRKHIEEILPDYYGIRK